VVTSDPAAIFAAALLLAALGALPCRRIALRLGLVDKPSERKLHSEATPLLGGPAIILAVVAANLLYSDSGETASLNLVLLGAVVISLFGLWDDKRELRPAVKLLVQLGAGLFLVAAGVQVMLGLPQWVNVTVTLVWVIGITNALNMLDNMDGLATCVAAIAAGCIALLAFVNGDRHLAALSLALCGACLGFLPHNANPARIFMGDNGSLFLGFLLAGLAIELRFPGQPRTVTWMVPVLILGLPVFDTTLVVVSRIRRHSNPLTTPGKDHLSHLLLRLGFTTRGAVLLSSLLCISLGGVAFLVSTRDPLTAYLCSGAVALIGLLVLVWLQLRFGGPEQQS
jgi:UDP-GlcNAc:undecaprenyl-phosphate GlcNAc-1-phosphate transferase